MYLFAKYPLPRVSLNVHHELAPFYMRRRNEMEGPECTRQLMSKDVNTSDSSRSSIVKWGALLVDSEWARLDMPIIRAPSDCTQPCMHAH